jgi:hypothetical protein
MKFVKYFLTVSLVIVGMYSLPRIANLSYEVSNNWLAGNLGIPSPDVILILGGDRERELTMLRLLASESMPTAFHMKGLNIAKDVPIVVSSGTVSIEGTRTVE